MEYQVIYPQSVKRTRGLCPQCQKVKNIPANRSICASCRTFNYNVSIGKVRAPDFAEVNTEGFKEPMEKVEGGFGFYGAVTTTNDDKHIQCHICGYYFANLGAHVSLKHKVKPRDYKIKYGLRISDGLQSPVMRMVAQENYNKNARKTVEEFREMSRKGAEVLRKKGYQGGHGWPSITRNEKGMCKEQTLAKIQETAERMDGIPTEQEFLRTYGAGQKNVVNHWFGSWREAVAQAGFTHYNDNRDERSRITKERILDTIKEFFVKEGRTPLYSDFRSISWLPDQRTVGYHYGTLNAARKAAEVPELLYLSGKWVEVYADV